MRILVVGDSYFGASVFAEVFVELETDHHVEYLQLDETRRFEPSTPSELRIREHAGAPEEICAAMPKVEVLAFHGAAITDEVLDASDVLKLVCCARGGPVNVDLEAASARGIPVTTTPGKNADAVADLTLAFLVMLARRIPKTQWYLLKGGTTNLSTFEGAEFFGHDLGGHVLGLVGFGHVGERVELRTHGFGLDVVVFDPYREFEATEPVAHVDSLEELLARADFVSLHARATAENENLFGTAAFATMKPGSYFVNTARETLVDEEALDAALASGHLAGAALDVVKPRSGSGPHPLLRHENVLITPHVGGATYETLLHGARMLVEDIVRFAAGEPLVNVINPSAVTA